NSMRPMNIDRFLPAALRQIAHLEGTHIYDAVSRDYLERTGHSSSRYAEWVGRLVPYLVDRYGLAPSPRILDFGCGTGTLTVLLNALGYDSLGIDLHSTHLQLGRLLAEDNGVDPSRLIEHREGRLPFPDKSFDIINLHVVVEHLSDEAL